MGLGAGRHGVTIGVLLATGAALLVSAVASDGGLLEVRRLRLELARTLVENGAQRVANAGLATRVEALTNDPDVLERHARRSLGYLREGDRVFRFEVAPPAP